MPLLTNIVHHSESAPWDQALVEHCVGRVVPLCEYDSALAPHCAAQMECAIVLSDDALIQPLNMAYRAKDKPTNVLSFASDEEEELGDLIFAYETIAAEAAAQCKSFEQHFTHLLIHGILHLMGYDHEEEADAQAMEAKEIALLSKLGIANPYE